jgi:hypothetical protein
MRLWALVPCFIYVGLGCETYGRGAETGSRWIRIAIGIGSMIAQQVAATSTVRLTVIIMPYYTYY